MTTDPQPQPNPVSTLVFDGPDALIVPPGPMRERLDRQRWSPSASKTVSKCPARFAAEKLIDEEQGPFDAAPIGTAAHRVLEVFYGEPAHLRTRERLAQIVACLHTEHAEHVVLPTSPQDLIPWQAEVMAAAMPIFEAEDPASVLVSGLERDLHSQIDGVPFYGKIDRTRLIVNEAGAIVGLSVDDYKSAKAGMPSEWKRKKNDDHGDQMRTYVLALEHLDGRRPEKATVVYTRTGQVRDVPLDDRSMNRVRREFVASWEVMKESARTGRYATGASPLCGWCPMSTVCPAAAAIDKNVPKVDKATAGERLGVTVIPHTVIAAPSQPDTAPASTDREVTMSQPQLPPIVEDKSWEEASTDGRLNGNSYASMAAFGYVAWAAEYLHGHGQPLTAGNVRAMAATLASIVLGVQESFSGRTTFQDGLNTRLRGALHTALDTLPAPFGGTEADWDQWVQAASKRTFAITSAAVDLWARGPGARPWEALVSSTAQAKAS